VSNKHHRDQIERLQRQRWLMYTVTGGFMGVIVGYYAVPRLQWFYIVVAVLSTSVGMQLSLMRQQRRTWQSRRIVSLLDASERIIVGLAIFVLSLYALIGDVPGDYFVAITSWSGLYFLVGNAIGEYWWQQRRFPQLDRSEQLRYLCASFRSAIRMH
jgi:hypothetical protein